MRTLSHARVKLQIRDSNLHLGVLGMIALCQSRQLRLGAGRLQVYVALAPPALTPLPADGGGAQDR